MIGNYIIFSGEVEYVELYIEIIFVDLNLSIDELDGEEAFDLRSSSQLPVVVSPLRIYDEPVFDLAMEEQIGHSNRENEPVPSEDDHE